ncbi:MAG: NAD-dependent epimerase [Cyclobacteriaceae bacterium]|nr:NAD-dependent epimerase [Cyclobacteriaceae bacterium]
MAKYLVTGAAGFIGFHVVGRLLREGTHEVVGLDVINDYYDVELKYARLAEHGIFQQNLQPAHLIESDTCNNYKFIQIDLADFDFIIAFMLHQKFDYVIHLAAQAGVRYSLTNPRAYTHSNIEGFLSILEGCRHAKVKHLVYASSSSVYGLNGKMPLSEKQGTQHPISLYAATKKANEMMAHSYSHLYRLPTSGLRFFSAYGPWGRPDMALFLFTDAIMKGKPIQVFNGGEMIRDFTYIDDIVESVFRLSLKPAQPSSDWDNHAVEPDNSTAPYRIFNVGNSSPVELNKYIEAIEAVLEKKSIKNLMEMQPGDVSETVADTSELEDWVNFKPKTNIEDGVERFVNWYQEVYLAMKYQNDFPNL